jgi:hypothetical protein
MTNRNFKNVLKKSLLLLAIVFSVSTLNAQLTGVKTIPGDYATISAFVADANSVGIGAGGVVVNVAGGHTETSTAVIALTATGTAANPIVIQKSGAGANPIITSYTGGTGTPGSATQDGVFALVGSDYVTIDGIDLVENAANTSNPSTMEYGFGMFKASATDGCQFNVIRNCAITLSNLNNGTGSGPSFDGSRGINLTNALITAQITTVTVTDALGANSNNQIYSNTISNVNIGVALAGFAAATPFNLGDTGNDVGGASLLTGNTIFNFGGAAAAANPAAGIRTSNQWSPNISFNTLNNNTGAGSNHVSTLRGILIGAAVSANATINNNSVTVNSGATTSLLEGISNAAGGTAAGNTININNNSLFVAYSTATTGNVNGIANTATAATVNINGNTITNIAALPILQNVISGTGTVIFITGGSPTTLNINNNTISTFARTSIAGGTTRGIVITTPTNTTISGNTVENLAYSNPLSTGNIDGIYSLSSAVTVTITNNIVRNLSTPTTGIINGIRENSVGGTKTITGNQVYSFATTSGGAGGGTFRGIYTTVGTITIQNNTIYNLISAGSTGGTGGSIIGVLTDGGAASILANKIYDLASNSTNPLVAGVHINGGTTNTAANNLIGNLRAPFANAANPLIGINITAGTTANVYYNTVHINGTSAGVLFGSSAISVSTTSNVTLRNNIFINESSFNGAAFAVAMRRSSTTLTSYNNASNNNLFYAGTPSANNLIMYDGTNSYGTLLAYQTAVLPRDVNSITGEAPFDGLGYATVGNFFTSLTGSSSDFLRPVAGITTQVESGAIAVVGVTTDFAGVTRPASGTNPDMGAYEFAGVSPAPVITLNSVTPSVAAQCVAADRLISVDVTTAAGTILSVNLGFTVNGVPQANIPMTNTLGTTWEATLPVQVPANALIAWGVSATNSIGLSSSFTGTSYSDEPLTGVTATATASITTTCANDPSALTASLSKSGSAVIGSGSTVSTNSAAVTPFYGGYGGVKTQYLIRANELTAMGFTAGNFTQLSVNITSAGSTLNGFAISAETTALTALTSNIENVGNQVFTSASFVPVVGVNNFPFSTPLAWDGVSNIIVSFCWSNNNTSNTVSNVLITATSFVSGNARYVDSKTSAEVCGYIGSALPSGWNGAATTVSSRPIFTFVGNLAPAITSVTWLDGATTVGTGNPLTVNPTATTTYTASITSAGCTFAPAPTVTVTVNPLPTAPTAVNSAQCGTQIPTASVTSTSGLPTPTFIWYDAAVAGSAMQNSTSTTYTSNVAATTTFYVAELNTLTACESARTAVTVTVAIADGITASADNAAICIGSPVVLSVVNNNGTPNQTYSYTWTNADAGSGLVSQTGSSITVTPTLPGTYIYDVVGVDGGCSAVSSISVTVNPFVASISPINVSCNGGNDGSFTLASSSCGTAPFDYSINGGAFGAIPTNMIAGVYTVVVMDDNGYVSATLPLTITEPSTTITNPTVTNAIVCQNDLSALITASATTSVPSPAIQVISFNLAAQPVEVNAAPGAVISSTTMPALPAGAVVTSVTLAFPGTISNGGSYQSEIRLGVQGAVLNNAAAGTGAAGAAGLYNYTRVLPNGSVNVGGGNIDLLYWNAFDDVVGDDATFPTGSGVATLTINYDFPTPATITWWDAPTGGTQIGAGSPFETVGTSVLPSTVTAGIVTLYAQGQNGACPSPGRTAATVTVNAPSTSTTTITACTSYTWTNSTTYTVGGTYTQVLTNAVGCDSTATLVLTINQPTSSTVTVVACNSYTWAENGTTYTATGNYPVVLAGANAVGCDSTVTLNLTINNSTTSTTPVTACDTYTWTNGTTYTVGGTYTQVLTNAAGCDSTATLVLTINNSSTSSTPVTACDSYTWTNGTTYAVGGTYTQVLTNAAGCDSTATLVLTINNSTASTTTITECDSYTWTNNITYTVGGTYTQVLTNAAGCDSTATLVLTINNSTASTTTITECDSYTWTNNTTYTVGGTYTQVLTNAAGCDSTATLVLTINNSTTGTDVQTACDSYTWIDGVTYTANNNTATFVLTNAAGCDSLVTLNLTITTSPTAVATDNLDATITASAGTAYQWIDCGTGLAIAGATAQTYTVTANGSYAVVVNNGACDDTSSCVVIDYIGIKEISQDVISVFPNPTRDFVTVNMTAANATIEVVDAQGKILQTSIVENGGTLSLASYETGMYIFRITTENGTSIHRISKN